MPAFRITGPWTGELAILPRPRGGEWLDDDTRAWRAAGFDVILSLLEPVEELELALQGESGSVVAAGMNFRSFPIPDRSVPYSREQFRAVVAELFDALTRGRAVGVHCRQGVGRSGVAAAGILIAAGISSDEAFQRISVARGVAVPEVDEQRAWTAGFAAWQAGRGEGP